MVQLCWIPAQESVQSLAPRREPQWADLLGLGWLAAGCLLFIVWCCFLLLEWVTENFKNPTPKVNCDHKTRPGFSCCIMFLDLWKSSGRYTLCFCSKETSLCSLLWEQVYPFFICPASNCWPKFKCFWVIQPLAKGSHMNSVFSGLFNIT